MQLYLDLLRKVLTTGIQKDDRTGTGTYSLFGEQFRHDLNNGFPLLTTKKIHLKSVIHELLWMLSGSTNVRYLQENGVGIWDEWAKPEDGELGPVYGANWRSWPTDMIDVSGDSLRPEPIVIDQIAGVIEDIRLVPDSRRLVVTAWNPATVGETALAPCHILFQFYVSDGRLSCHMYQRSADIFLGVPFNIASYALLTMMIAQVTGLKPGELVISFGDLHLYRTHVEQAMTQIRREPKVRPLMMLDPTVMSIDKFVYESFKMQEFEPPWPAIKAEVAV